MYSCVGVGAHIRPPSLLSTNFSACRFRASPPTHTRRELQSENRTWDSFGLICKSGRSERGGSVVVRDGEVAAVTVREVDDGVVAIGYGWKVREAARFDVEELRAVAHVQASSFHIEAAVFDDLFFKLFKAEVLSTLLYKAKHSPPDRYACLLAEPATMSMDDDEPAQTLIVGAVNLAASVENEVLRHLQDASDEYLYVSGMAVDINHRRQNVATLLLGACELLATKWGFSHLALHAYEDDMAARTLYARGGYRVVALDPLWMSTWVGRKRRVLMAKPTSKVDSCDARAYF